MMSTKIIIYCRFWGKKMHNIISRRGRKIGAEQRVAGQLASFLYVRAGAYIGLGRYSNGQTEEYCDEQYIIIIKP